MAQFRYPGKLDEKHPVVTRISIIKRFSLLGDIATADSSAFSQQFAGIDGALAAAASEKNKKIVEDKIKATAQRQIAENKDDPLHQIYLYAPSSIQFADGLAYDNQELGVIAGAIFGAADAAASEGGQSTGEKVLSVAGGLAAGLLSEV